MSEGFGMNINYLKNVSNERSWGIPCSNSMGAGISMTMELICKTMWLLGFKWVTKPQFTFPGVCFYQLSKSAAALSESGNSCVLRSLLFARNIIPCQWYYETEHKLGLGLGAPFPDWPIPVACPFHLPPLSEHPHPPDAPEIWIQALVN